MTSLGGPVELAGRAAASRVLFGPHVTNLGHRRELSPRHVAYYERRAVGGAGVVVVETASVHPSDHPYERAPLAADCVDGWSAVVRACRPHGALVLAGLGHAGSQGSTAYTRDALWGASCVADPGSREVPMVVEQPEIDALVAGYTTAATLAAVSDVDGVEVEAGQHSILRQFLSGLTNLRTDGYGVDRARLLREVLAAVRAALGPDRILGLRLGMDELAPWAGITPESGAATAAQVARWIDYLVPVRGSALTLGATRPDAHTAPGVNRGLCAGLRVGVPVVWQGSVVDPTMAKAALDDGVCTLVEMTRALIADPDLVAHVRAGEPERIRPCTLSNRHFDVRDPRNTIISDDAEPRSGHESIDPPVEGRDAVARSVLVVGGGPAGLEAARTLALRGHRVRLVEREATLGGALRWAAALDQPRLGLLISWWTAELARLGVEVELGTEVTPEWLRAHVAAEVDAEGGRGGSATIRRQARWSEGTAVGGSATVRPGAGGSVVPDVGDSATRPPAARWSVVLATGSHQGPRAFPSDGPVLTAAECAAILMDGGAEDPGHDRRFGASGGHIRPDVHRAGDHAGFPVLARDSVAGGTGAAGPLLPAEAPGPPDLPHDRRLGAFTGHIWPDVHPAGDHGGGPVLVHDPLGDGTGVAVAEQLAGRGYVVVLVTPDPVAGAASAGDLAPANARLERAGVVRATYTRLLAVRGGVATLEHVLTGVRRDTACAAVVDCGHRLPENALASAFPGLPRAGDCVAPRTLHEAVREGRAAALSVARC